jgi:hypothetical protein
VHLEATPLQQHLRRRMADEEQGLLQATARLKEAWVSDSPSIVPIPYCAVVVLIVAVSSSAASSGTCSSVKL